MTPADNPRPTGRKRSAARLAAVQALYQIEMSGALPTLGEIDRIVSDFLKHRMGRNGDGEAYGEIDERLFGADGRQGRDERTQQGRPIDSLPVPITVAGLLVQRSQRLDRTLGQPPAKRDSLRILVAPHA